MMLLINCISQPTVSQAGCKHIHIKQQLHHKTKTTGCRARDFTLKVKTLLYKSCFIVKASGDVPKFNRTKIIKRFKCLTQY